MKKILAVMVMVFIIACMAYAAGDVDKGKMLFNDTKFAGATSGNSCGTCHPGGKGLEDAASKTTFTMKDKAQKSLEEVVNLCIAGGLKGKAIDVKSADMANIVAYIRSRKAEPAKTPNQ